MYLPRLPRLAEFLNRSRQLSSTPLGDPSGLEYAAFEHAIMATAAEAFSRPGGVCRCLR